MKVRLKVFEWLSKTPQVSPKVVFSREFFLSDFALTIDVLNSMFASDSIRYYTFELSTLPHAL